MRIHAAPVMLAAALIAAATTGCARKSTVRVPPSPAAPARIGATETGLASWYGLPYDGRPAASGEIYHMDQLTAAHRTLPFQTWVEVTDLDNQKRVNVRIIDRGPFVDGRVIDLSQAAAREIGMLGPGIARVRLKVIAPPRSATRNDPPEESDPSGGDAPLPDAPVRNVADRDSANRSGGELPPFAEYAVQVGAFSERERAESLQASLADRFADTRVIQGSPLWHVLVGRRMTLDAANKLAASLRRSASEAIVVRDR
jgi:peptidoglycan lytic transglycosylase